MQMKTTRLPRRAINTTALSRDEARVIIAMLERMIQREVNYGANLEDLALPASWHRAAERKVRRLCEQLVARGIFLRQHGADYHHYNYRGPVRDQREVWYSFNETLFVWGQGIRPGAHFAALAAALMPHVAPATVHQLLVAALELIGRFIDSNTYKHSARALRARRRSAR